jgi:pyruvate dehydrogenase E2 component (dihydrolipoamide acetyltransferase)
VIAGNLGRAVAEVPQVDTFRTVRCGAIEALRGELGVSPLPVVARALVDVCSRHPLMNASYLAVEGVIRTHHRVHLGVATHTDRGLVVVVVRDAGSFGIAGLGDEIGRLAAAARENTLAPADVTGATLSISNTGSYGSEWGTPLVIPPQGVILGLGRIEPRALVVDSEVKAVPACTISLGFDHRLLDGRTAGEALTDLVNLLEDPARLRDLPA